MGYASAPHRLTIKHVVETNVQRCLKWHGDGGLQSWTPLEWAGAMCGESGEAANAAKKLKRMQSGMDNVTEREFTIESAKDKVAKECADTILYALLLIASVDRDAETVLRDVFNTKSSEYGFPERI